MTEEKAEQMRETAILKYGFCWTPSEWDKRKAEARIAIESEKLNDQQIVEKEITVLMALFSRSLHASIFNMAHPYFHQYAAMLLNQESWKSSCNSAGETVYAELVKIFGTSSGIPTGSYFFR